MNWAFPGCTTLADPATYRADPETLWERLRPRTSNRRQLGLLRAIAAWREREAQRANIPRQRMLKDETLLEIAATAPETPETQTARVAPRLVASSEDIDRLATEDEPPVRALHGWRRDVFGADALALKAGRIALGVDGRRVKLIGT